MVDVRMGLILFLHFTQVSYGTAQMKDSLFLHVCEDNSLLLYGANPFAIDGLSKAVPCTKYFAFQRQFLSDKWKHCFCVSLPDSGYLSTESTGLKLYYAVEPRDGLYAIARRKLKIPLEALKNLNPRNHYNLKQGEILHVGWLKIPDKRQAHEYKDLLTGENKPGTQQPLDSHEKMTYPSSDRQNFKNTHRGLAYVITGAFGNNRLLALHDEAPMHSLIALDNPVTGRRVYAKVVGRIPKAIPGDAIIVVSDDLARELGSLDHRFLVVVHY